MSGSGETDLPTLLRSLRPVLNEGAFVFCTVSREQFATLNVSPVCTFMEAEGVTLILTQAEADTHSFSYTGRWVWITLTVHSSLAAVGLLAAVTAVLAKADIPANVVSAFFHDQLFVPQDKAQDALTILHSLTQ